MTRDIVIPMTRVAVGTGFHLLVKATLKGAEVTFIVDTGASKSLLDNRFTDEYLAGATREPDLVPNQGFDNLTFSGDHITLPTLTLGGEEFKEFPAILTNIEFINEVYLKGSIGEVDGLIGSDFLVKYGALIDIKNLTILLHGIE